MRTALALFVVLVGGCGHKPPYTPGRAPAAEALLAATAPQLDAIAVGDAKVVANRVLRGNLAFIAQKPARFRGSVTVAGNELATLAFHEQGYALRYKLDAFPQGYYAGPPSPCAVEALIGVPLDTDDLVALVLGGAPVLRPPYEILDQKWDRKGGWERLVIADSAHVEELHFVLDRGTWRFAGAVLWRRTGKERGAKLWSLEYTDLAKHGPAVLPERIKVRAPTSKGRENLVVITYKKVDTDPEFAKQIDDDGGEEGGEQGGGTPGNDDDDGGWENAEPDAPEPEPKPEPKPDAAAGIPTVFRLEPTGLTVRGDLCR